MELKAIDIPGIKLVKQGKVRDIYDLGDELLLVASDRMSAFDVVLPTIIPEKGKVLTQVSKFWFDKFKASIPNHLSDNLLSEVIKDKTLLAELEPRTMRVRKAEPVMVEAIVRGYITGSGWEEYKKNNTVCGIKLKDGLRESEQLPEPIFTPSTKAAVGDHDENISFNEAVNIIGEETANNIKELSIKIYSEAAKYARTRGIIIADTKFEFGYIDGRLVLIDEVLTPDSSRFWPMDLYQPGQGQPSYDKQYIRDWLMSSGWNKTPPGPVLPEDVVEQTTAKYQEAYKLLTA